MLYNNNQLNANNDIKLDAKMLSINKKKILIAINTITGKLQLSIKISILENRFNQLNFVS